MPLSRGQFLRTLGGRIGEAAANMGVVAATRLLAGAAAVSASKATPAPSTTLTLHRQGPATGNQVALTFDDGPTPGVTDRILDELARRQVRATFFMIGQKANAAPDLARRVVEEGHEIGNHTYTHARLSQLPDAKAREEIERTQETLLRLTGCAPRLLRPPFGELRKNQADLIQQLGLQVVLWSLDSKDWSQPSTIKGVQELTSLSQPGSIFLFHDLKLATAEILPAFLDAVGDKELSLSTISSLLCFYDS